MKWRAQAFNVFLSSARQWLTPLFSNYFLQIWGGWGREAEAGEPIASYRARLLALGHLQSPWERCWQ